MRAPNETDYEYACRQAAERPDLYRMEEYGDGRWFLVTEDDYVAANGWRSPH